MKDIIVGKSWLGKILVLCFFAINLQASSQTEKLNYDELQRLENEALNDNNNKRLRKLTTIHATKARRENNNIEQARAFYYRTAIEKPETALVYTDSIIAVTANSDHLNYPTLGYILKGQLYYDSGDFTNSLDNFLVAYNLAMDKDNEEHQREISIGIAAIRNIHGQHSAAADLYRRSLNLLKKESGYEVAHYDDYLTLLYNLSLTHLRMSQFDSAQVFIATGIKLSRAADDIPFFRDFVLVDAQVNYFKKNYLKAQDTLKKYVDQLSGTSQAIKFYYLGKISKIQNDEEQALIYFRNVDSIVSITGDLFNEVKDVYQQLIVHSSLEGDRKGQIEYIEKLIHADSILSLEQQSVLNQAVIAFDVPYLKHQKKKVENELKIKSAAANGIGILALMAVISGIYFYLRSKAMKDRLQLLLEGSVEVKNKKIEVADNPPSVPLEIRENILAKLEVFENSKSFLSKEIDLSGLAQEFGTNTSYLSTMVNHYKGRSFPNYLKDLKISYAIKCLNEEPDLLKYNYQGLADLFGFKTGDSFSKAFYAKTGVYPSKFLNELKSRKNHCRL